MDESNEVPVTTKKAKNEPITAFQKQCKCFFSSVSARGCKYLYLNFPGYENILVLTNADPDMLTTYTLASMISIHLIIPKDDFLDTFRKLFTPGIASDQPYIIRSEMLTKAFKTYRVESVFTNVDQFGTLFIMGGGNLISVDIPEPDEDDLPDEFTEDDTTSSLNEFERLLIDDGWDAQVKRSLFTKEHIAGAPLIDPFVLFEMERIIVQVLKDLTHCETVDCIQNDQNVIPPELQGEEIPTEEHQLKVVTFDQTDLVDQTRSHANWYRTTSFSGDQLGLPKKHDYRKQRLLLIDGLDTPCVTEFLKKKIIKGQFIGELQGYIYNSSGDTARCLVCYNGPDVKIITTRPYMETTLIPHNPDRPIRHISPREISYELTK